MAEQEDKQELMIQLPWTVPQQPLMTAQIEIDPETKKIPLDLSVSSIDWVVVVSVIASAFISFIGFLITIYLVKKSTEAQINSNYNLIKSHEATRNMEVHLSFAKTAIDKVAGKASKFILLLSDLSYKYGMINKHILENKKQNKNYKYMQDSWVITELDLINNLVQEIRLNISEISFYLNLLEIDFNLIKQIDDIEPRIYTLIEDIESKDAFQNVTDLFVDSKKIKHKLEISLIECMKKAA